MQGQIVTQVLRQRIGERIGSLKISWRQASIDAGLGSGFIQDLSRGVQRTRQRKPLSGWRRLSNAVRLTSWANQRTTLTSLSRLRLMLPSGLMR